ncbi:MAG: glycoside hydrolase family 3 N-terminal domain-containing protein [Ilumatobacteraceae bacterium]
MADTTDAPARFRDPAAPIPERVADLLERMTLDEKLAQVGSCWVFQLADSSGFDADRADPLLAHGIGHVTRVCGASSLMTGAAARLANDIQRHLVEHTRLGIPAIIHEEICSGLMAREATVYPQALGVAATFRPEHNHALADAIRRHMRAIGAHQGLSPVLDVCRDPRWGRLEETYGEDPYLVSQMGVAFIRGLQGETPDELRTGVVATAKHFVGYGASEGGMNWAPPHLPERELRDVYLRPFEAAVRDAGLASVMNAYNELDGVPCAANRHLLTDVLRGEWGFDGTVVADYFAVKQLDEYHHVVDSWARAAGVALHAGIDVELPSTECYGEPLAVALRDRLVDADDLDQAVARVLTTKFRLGLFDDPYVDEDTAAAEVRTVEQVDRSRRMAADSLVLLANDGVLPLRPDLARVALIGPNAASARHLLGDYSYITHVESLVEVLRSGQNVFAMPLDHGVDIDETSDIDHVGTVRGSMVRRLTGVEVRHAPGCGVTGDDRSGFADAVAAAAASDVAVMVMGERSGLTEDCTTGESRDVASLDLPGVQEELVLAVAATGTPVVLVLVAGRPIGSPRVHEAAAAVLMAWLPGEQGSEAIVDALVGDVSPGGKLPVTFPRTSGQIPIYASHKVSGGRSHWKGSYVDVSNEPLYPFGHGLSYTTFDVLPDGIGPTEVAIGDRVDVRAVVRNTGDRTGDEVVQLYVTDPVSTITRPVRELIGFVRVTLPSGAAVAVTFHVPVTAFGHCGVDLRHVVEPGEFRFSVGTSSTDHTVAGSVFVTGDHPLPCERPSSNDVTVEPLHQADREERSWPPSS